MAKRRFFKRARSSTSRFTRRAKSAYSKGGSSSIGSRLETAGYGFGYGSVRSTIHNKLSGIIPTNWALKEEAVLGLGGFLLGGSKNRMLKKIGDTMLTVESASIGHQTVAPMIENSIGGSTQTSSGIYLN